MPADTELIITVSPMRQAAAGEEHVPGRAEATCSAAASWSLSSSGTFTSCLVGATTYSAKPPGPATPMKTSPPSRYGITRSPTCQSPSTSAPSSAMRADDLEAEDVRELDREARDALSDVHVHVVERAGVHLDAHVPGPGLRILDLLDRRRSRAAELVDAHCLHATSSFPVVALETTVSRPTSLMPDIALSSRRAALTSPAPTAREHIRGSETKMNARCAGHRAA